MVQRGEQYSEDGLQMTEEWGKQMCPKSGRLCLNISSHREVTTSQGIHSVTMISEMSHSNKEGLFCFPPHHHHFLIKCIFYTLLLFGQKPPQS